MSALGVSKENGEIHLACQNGDEVAVKQLLENEETKTDVDVRGANGMTGLHYAALKGHVHVIRVRGN